MKASTRQAETSAAHSWSTRFAWTVLAVGLALGPATAARAASFSVNPVQVFLSGANRSALVSIKNETDQPVRFQMSVVAWAQDPDGQLQLAPTEDVVFFPALLTLQGHEERKVRVGVTVSAGAVEKTYRLFVEELPPLERRDTPNAISMTTKMGIPIFLRPVQATSQATLQDLNVKAGHFRFSLRNGGTVHFVPQTVRVHGLDEAGATVLDKEISGWYVLAGGLRVFDLELPAAQCARFRSFVVEVQVSGTTLKEALQMPAGTCGT